MQTGAFIQLILTLAAIVSRMAAIVSDLDDAVQRTIQVLDRLLKVLKDETMLSAPEEVTHVESKDRLLMDEVTLTQTVVPIVVEREHKPEKSSSAANKDTSKKKKKKRDEIDDIFGF
ncbi:hypothetical protein VKT23_005398 [Stygiomarasmius scandens]|uniref:Uncharacterized protein n=1 Tax=Marasmiellus scandens TaxID=2682957 RepID=A0ABR1JVV8_9AGAR